MNKPKIVMIDSGVYGAHPDLAEDEFKEIVIGNGTDKNEKGEFYGHGTAIYGIIRKVQDYFEIISIKVCGIENGIDEKMLYRALLYVEKHIDAAIINLSLGSAILRNKDKIEAICNRLTENGTIIVSAFDNSGAISYPAAFQNVIGVISGSYCRVVSDLEYVEDSVVNIAGKGNFQRVLWSNPQYLIIGGNSFACAHVTVYIANLIVKGYTKKSEILQQLKLNAVKVHTMGREGHIEKIPYRIKRAALFPFNKEMHSLIRYADLLEFHIVSVYDSKYSARVGADTAFLLNDKNVKAFTIKNITEIEWDEIDTLILGHADILEDIAYEPGFIDNLLNEAMDKNKNIYMFDDFQKDYLASYSNIFSPRISTGQLPRERFGMLYRISKPVLGVCGTSSGQGKFTLQLALRKKLMEEGYKVGQIGTEPSALLYGMDFVFPMGYHSSVYIKEYDVIRYLNNVMNLLCEDNNDLIIVGTQSGTIPYDTGNLVQYNIMQHLFLLGTQPDAVVLCVNPFDDIDYIKRTIDYIESFINSHVIAIVVFPMDISDDWTGIYSKKVILSEEKWNLVREQLSGQFLIPVYKLGCEKDMNKISEDIIDFFADETDEIL